jgi:hypothetical protein
MSIRRTATNATSGSFTLGPVGAQKNMDALPTGRIQPGTLSARVYWSAYTNTMTLTGKWQGSADNSTWRDFHGQNNAAHVVLQTSTGTGAKYIEAPLAVHGLPYVRFALVSGVASGTVGDTYSMSYNYVKRDKADDFRRL